MSNKYLVIHMTDRTGGTMAEGEDQRLLEDWADEGSAAGSLGEGAPVAGPDQAKSVAVRHGKVLVTDGPFPEFKEWFAGYDIVTAESIDEAASFMAKHPMAVMGRVYILPVVNLPWDED